ncbi:hypothetical protein QQS21_008111 [Conoideocrella luteorostrata]|uniref:Amidohydrolase-related domain-containing protein n=1 Tax=Conoideocrella luteorostrata TaxID=1105319 RepID=A0AAJ0CM80_9HYPO|nr:hypothetical protein QQS21_008111 [Conoideocrella luteorostrata]
MASQPMQTTSTVTGPVDSNASAKAVPATLIKPWKLPSQKTYILRNASIVDSASGSIHKNQSIKLAGGIIKEIASEILASSGDIVVNVAGKYICPGLIDCHVHLTSVAGDASLSAGLSSPDAAISYFRQPFLCKQILSRGFTAVRDTGGATLALKEAIDDDVFPGPRLVISNKALSQTGGHGDMRGIHEKQKCCGGDSGLASVVDGVPGCIQATREQLRTGADFIKIMAGGGVASPTDKLENTQFTAAEIQAITEVADTFGTYVTAHAYTPKAIRHAVDNGVKGIEHGNFIDAETAQYMAKRDIWLTPTLVTYDAMGSSKYAGFLPPANREKNREVLSKGLESLRLAEEAGVTICHGSDLLGPLHEEQSREFSIRARALSNKTVLQGATINAAKMLRQEKFLGQVKEGFAADLLILNGNPLEDVSILGEPKKTVLVVIKNGRVYMSRWSGLPEDVVQAETAIE